MHSTSTSAWFASSPGGRRLLWHKGMDLDNMCGSNLFVRTSSFIFLNSFVEKTRLSPLGGGVIEDPWVGGWALGVRAARRIAILPVLDAIFHYILSVRQYYKNTGE